MKIQRTVAVAILSLVLSTAVHAARTSPADFAEPAQHPALPTESAPATLDALLHPRATATGDTSPLRIQMISDAGRTVGFRGGVASRAAAIRASLEKRGPELDGLFNFAPLIMPSGALPPVIVEAQDVASFGAQQYRTASKVYRIERAERFVSVPPTWRDYLYTGLPTNPNVSLPITEAQPKTSDETDAWQRAVRAGWQDGLAHASAILRANFSRMTRDYNGMIAYSTLLQKGMISQTRVAETQRVVTGNANELMIGDTTRRLTAPAQLQPDANRWTPTVSYAPGYRISAPTEPADSVAPLQAASAGTSQPVVSSIASDNPAQVVYAENAGATRSTVVSAPSSRSSQPSSDPSLPLQHSRLMEVARPSPPGEKPPAAAQVKEEKVAKITVPAEPIVPTVEVPSATARETLSHETAPVVKPSPSREEHAAPADRQLAWDGHQGETLREVVTRWAQASSPSWHVDWQTDLDYRIVVDFTLRADSFLDAAARVFTPYHKAKRRFTLSQQPEQRVLIVEEE
ncbi:DotC protein [plant metagenome]|uniref:DotC protein n=1 Tax=plant metagenome TaxID=1297885 RepID=A0A484UHH3_9ZZZZ